MQPVKSVKNFFRKYPLTAGKKYLIALSGGPDSMILLEVFRKLKLNFVAAHCNFQLRGKESNLEEKFVTNYCRSVGVKLIIKRFDTANFCAANKVGIQEGARMLRYDWFSKLLVKEHLDYLATAHHKNDLAETYIFNLLRGTGLNGLRGMLPIRNKIIRPLLEASKEELIYFAKKNHIPYCTDSSNLSNHYSRNYIRNIIIPALASEIPDIINQLSDSAADMQKLVDYRDKRLADFVQRLVMGDKNRRTLALHSLQKNAFETYLLKQYLHSLGFFPNQIGDICRSVHGNTFLCPGFIATNNRGILNIEPHKAAQDTNATKQYLLAKENGIIYLPGSELHLLLSQIKPIFDNQSNHYLDADKLAWPLTIRRWLPGDRIIPLGMTGYKKVSDLLTDIKMNPVEKNNVFVMISNNKIAAVLGIRTSDEFKITASTNSYAVVSILD